MSSVTKQYITIVAVISFVLGLTIAALAFRFSTPKKNIPISNIATFKGKIEFDEFGNIMCSMINTSLFSSSGYCYSGTIKGEKGLIIAHPFTKEVPTTTIINIGNVTDDISVFSFKVANIADSLDKLGITKVYGDTRIVVIAMSSKKEPVVLDDFIVDAKDGWITKEYDITQFRGSLLSIFIYGFAGGKELWNGEWYGIGEVEVR